jgi:xanthosine utilization system XapX-like protein
MVAGSVVSLLYALLLWSSVSIVLLALGPIGLIVGRNVFNYVYRRPQEKMAWWYAHMGAMFGAGIAFHTAFLVFGSREVLDLSILGPFNWVPWVAPGIIGVFGGEYWKNMYRRRFQNRLGRRTEGGVRA